METISSIDPVILKIIGSSVLCWFAGWCAGKVYKFVSEIFKKASRSH